MIKVTNLGNNEFYINPDMIEKIEARPDTTIILNNGHIYIVKETVEEIINEIIEFRSKIFSLGFKRGD
ncbi:flagellar FlbD family protein [Marinitoga litoralis]|jgi:flagellar protein FlbD|uniref:flagellar FlbD family protein n=1 Tax=Marinitoga litoralis TaxID=570855 RepID=UPI0019602B24|nr:flagellar FlbD family protein [Marinitoga litoralis]MBM7558925.1 flagellar protein FlbD [Marinitoga litoralis]